MGKQNIPDRWLDYKPMGAVIPGTRFLACKVPLREGLLKNVPANDRFGPADLKKAYPNLRLLVDLTNTDRYYSKTEFIQDNIKYVKIMCPGHVVPPNSLVKRFKEIVDQFVQTHEDDPDAVIGVHCTHGVNRSGYFICRYMIENLNLPPESALTYFHLARGHNIERLNYMDDLKNGCKGGSEKDLEKVNKLSYKKVNKFSKRSVNLIPDHHKMAENLDQTDDPVSKNWRNKNDSRSDSGRSSRDPNMRGRDQTTHGVHHGRGRTQFNTQRRPPPEQWRTGEYHNVYHKNINLQGRHNIQLQPNEGVLPNTGMNVHTVDRSKWRNGVFRNFSWTRDNIQANPHSYHYRGGAYPNREKYPPINVPGSWREEQKSSDFKDFRNEHSQPKIHRENYQYRGLNKSFHGNTYRSWKKEYHRDNSEAVSSKGGPEQQEPQLPGTNFGLKLDHHHSGTPNPHEKAITTTSPNASLSFFSS